MLPWIPPGAVLEVCARPALRVAEVALVRHGEGLTAHRVVALDAAGVVTRGDAHRADDAPTRWDDVLATVVAVRVGPLRLPLDGSIGRAIGYLAIGQTGRLLARTAAALVRAVAPRRRRTGRAGEERQGARPSL